MTAVFALEKLSKVYRDGSGKELRILSDISFEFPQQKTISIAGSSGSGKSTLLNLLGGLDRPTSGKVLFKSEDIYQYNSDALSDWRNRQIGFIFQAHHLLPDFTAMENITIPAMIAGVHRQQAVKRAEVLLHKVGLQDRMHHKPGQLSGGEQQRIAIARALINEPDVILADEPTGNLDNQTGDVVGQLLQEICHNQKTTLVLVTHNVQLAASMELQLKLFKGKLQSA